MHEIRFPSRQPSRIEQRVIIEGDNVTEHRLFAEQREELAAVRPEGLMGALVELDDGTRHEARGLASQVEPASAREKTDCVHSGMNDRDGTRRL